MNFCQMPLANDPFTHEIELRQYVMLKHVRGLYKQVTSLEFRRRAALQLTHITLKSTGRTSE